MKQLSMAVLDTLAAAKRIQADALQMSRNGYKVSVAHGEVHSVTVPYGKHGEYSITYPAPVDGPRSIDGAWVGTKGCLYRNDSPEADIFRERIAEIKAYIDGLEA